MGRVRVRGAHVGLACVDSNAIPASRGDKAAHEELGATRGDRTAAEVGYCDAVYFAVEEQIPRFGALHCSEMEEEMVVHCSTGEIYTGGKIVLGVLNF